jgi:hypothetical protein
MTTKRLIALTGAVGAAGALAYALAANAADQPANVANQVTQTGAQSGADLSLKPGTFLPGNPPVVCVKPKLPKRPPKVVRVFRGKVDATLNSARALRKKLPAKFKKDIQNVINALKDIKARNPCWPPPMKTMMGTSASCSTGGDD